MKDYSTDGLVLRRPRQAMSVPIRLDHDLGGVMKNGRTVALTAAMAGALIVPLAIGQPAARADELSDLRANQQLLQQRVDQLAQLAAAPGAKGAPVLAGSFPRSFLIPGTDTSMAISGFIRLNIDYFFQGAAAGNGITGEPNNTIGENGVVLTTPLNVPASCVSARCDVERREHARTGGNFHMNVRESRLRVETRTPTPFGPAGTVFEFDFAGGGKSGLLHVPDSLTPRLRLAYGTLGPWLVGQDYSLFNDLAAHPTTLDFGGEVGPTGTVRPPQLRYTWKGYNGFVAAADIEAPDTTLLTPLGGIDNTSTATLTGGINPTKNAFPDVVGRLDWHQPWGHLSARGVMANDQVNDGRFISRTFIGYGGAVSGDFKPGWFGWSRDDFTFGAGGGVGMLRYFNGSDTWDLSSNLVALPATPAAAALVRISQNHGWEAHLGYEHWWGPHLRSNFSGGIQRKEMDSSLLAAGAPCITSTSCWTANKELITTHVNLVYSPVSFVNVGAEWVHGHRLTNAGLKGDLDMLIGQVTVKF